MEKDSVDYASFAVGFEQITQKSRAIYEAMIAKNPSITNQELFSEILVSGLSNVVENKLPGKDYLEKIKKFGKSIVEHITGNYEIGIGDADFETLLSNTEVISSVVAYSNNNELENRLEEPEESGIGVSDGVVATGLIESPDKPKAVKFFSLSGEDIKKFFNNALKNITHLNEHVAEAIATISGMNDPTKQGLNDNLLGKTIGGLAYEFLSGTLLSKRHFTDVRNSESMQQKIAEEGILHFTSPANVMKILESGKVNASNILDSDLTKKKSFFFAGTPTFEDLLINIPAYNVMTAVRIKPTEEQMDNLKYRALNDRAVVQDGAFEFTPDQAEIAYFGLMYDKEKGSIYLGEITEEESKSYIPPKEVTDAYRYEGKKGFSSVSNFVEMMKMNTYGMFAEYKHHQKLLQMQSVLRENGISFRDVNDATLVELADIEQAYVSTKDNSVDRRTLFSSIKEKLNIQKDKESERENEGNELYE